MKKTSCLKNFHSNSCKITGEIFNERTWKFLCENTPFLKDIILKRAFSLRKLQLLSK